ncbi:uncharacterized protein LOC113215011 isoform X1 [Frankliniella occidentalis]|uniref:Uncharacterized protein LOC113215011 isoform X1 n=2 Tax=Frankliniella occidentalis TaxID=133901 RepID=A0A6J1THM6_FRAOC|nr:uncharacterized protein LOC113215011 isoform X1 [Frankliniella occidentalis]XP_026290344.1 uncharacterized protein LOC113215011 isoform X1 [Frankliniella occidentalis]XP_052130741.1 uncharacterized protein LOC113215011 isoform X1 [Frankliniella occidentalis]
MLCARAVGALLALVLVSGVALAVVMVEAPLHPDDTPRTLVVDTDAGADDAVAILEILQAEARNLRPFRTIAITCVQGNTGVENVTRNVLATLKIADRLDIPVYAGAAVALLPPRPSYSGFFGSDGFGDFLDTFPAEPAPEQYLREGPAAVALVRLVKENPGQLTLVCIGPLTNVALAARLDPGFLDNLRDLFILGGAARGNGNAAPGAEFNVLGDPGAAAVVLEAVTKPVYLLPWETVMDAELPMEWRVKELGEVRSIAMKFLNLAESVALSKMSTWTSGDGLLAAHLIDGAVAPFGRAVRVAVLVGEGPARGVTLVDYANTTGLPANAVLIEKPDTSLFKRLLLDLLG